MVEIVEIGPEAILRTVVSCECLFTKVIRIILRPSRRSYFMIQYFSEGLG